MVEQDCPAGLLFTTRGYCDYAWNVQCDGRALPPAAELAAGIPPGWNPYQGIIIYLSIYKIKVLSVHWSKSRHILVAHVSNKVMNENSLNKIPVCLYVCFRGFREKWLTIHLKTAAGTVMKFHIWIRCLLTYVFSYITF